MARDAKPDGPGLDAAADELYRMPPDGFVVRRDELAQQARAAGDRALATAIRGLRRPALAAWAVNLLARSEAAQLEQVLAVGDELRAAQRELRGDELRALGRQRRDVVAAVARRVGALAAEAGHRLTDAAAATVQETLSAALADPAAARAVRAGRLTTPLRYAGMGEEDDGAPDPAEQRPPRDELAYRRRQRRERQERELADARQACDEAAAAADRADADVTRAEQQREERAQRIERLRAELTGLEEEAQQAERAGVDLRRAARLADRQRGDAERRVQRLRDQLDS